MSDETYNGWSNRETWCQALWIDNDEGLYLASREEVKGALKEGLNAYRTGFLLKEWWTELCDIMDGNSEWHSMLHDIGSAWRVDWIEIAENWLSEYSEYAE